MKIRVIHLDSDNNGSGLTVGQEYEARLSKLGGAAWVRKPDGSIWKLWAHEYEVVAP